MSATHPPHVRRPAGWTPPSHRRTLAVLAAITVAAALVAAVAGRLAGDAVVTEQAPGGPTFQTAGLGAVTLAVPAAWAGADRIPEIRDLDRARTAAFSPAPGREAYVIATLAPADDPMLVPVPLRELVTGELPRPASAHLAGVPAWRYAKLSATNGRILDLTVAATTSGSLTVACLAAPEARSSVAGCEAAIGRVTLSGADWRPPAEVAGGLRLDAVIARLDRARVARRAALRSARTRAAQSRIAARLAGSYAAAAAGLRDAGPVADALRTGERAHRRLAAAAAAGRPARYAAAKRAVTTADAALARALASG
jgi:hypothetical protein